MSHVYCNTSHKINENADKFTAEPKRSEHSNRKWRNTGNEEAKDVVDFEICTNTSCMRGTGLYFALINNNKKM